jgi:hypothetical protein
MWSTFLRNHAREVDRAAVPAFVTGHEPYRFVIHDRDAIYSGDVDRAPPQRDFLAEHSVGPIRRNGRPAPSR